MYVLSYQHLVRWLIMSAGGWGIYVTVRLIAMPHSSWSHSSRLRLAICLILLVNTCKQLVTANNR